MIKLINIKKEFDNNLIYDNFNLDIEENKITAIIGPSGIGKTTLINMICGITKIDDGEIILQYQNSFSYVFQEPRLLNWLSVYDNLDFVLHNNYDSITRKKLVNNFIEIVELQDYSSTLISELSGGMAQRVSLARAFIYPSKYLILDEPFKGLDVKLEESLINKFIKLWKNDKRTVIYITHNIKQAINISDTIIIINNKPVNIIKKYYKNTFNSNTEKEITSLL